MDKFPGRIFVSGTDTGVGKTVVSAMLVSGLCAAYWKPVQSGLDGMTDTQWVQEKTGLPESHFFRETYCLKEPVSPHASAAREGVEIELDRFVVPETGGLDHLVIEGAGGIMVPLNDRHFMLDLMKRIGAPVLIVSPSRLGVINHTLLSIEQLRRHEIDILGVVMNGPKNRSNRYAVEYYGEVAVLAETEDIPEPDPERLKQSFHKYFLKEE